MLSLNLHFYACMRLKQILKLCSTSNTLVEFDCLTSGILISFTNVDFLVICCIGKWCCFVLIADINKQTIMYAEVVFIMFKNRKDEYLVMAGYT